MRTSSGNKQVDTLKLSVIILSCTIFFSCGKGNKQKEVSDEIVIKIGSVEITKYEFEKNKMQFEQTNSRNGASAYKNWLDDYIDQAYLLADAYDKHYDMADSVIKTVDFATLDKIAEVDGYVWQKLEEPKLQLSRSDLKEAYKKYDKMFVLEGLFFPNDLVIDDFLKGSKVNKEIYYQLVKQCKENKSVQFFSASMKWPFSTLSSYAEKIYALNEGDVIGPLVAPQGNYILFLAKKEKVKQQPFNIERRNIENELKGIKAKEIINNKQKEVFQKSHMVIDEIAVDKLSKELLVNNSQPNNLSLVLMTYSINDSIRNYMAKDYWDYVQYYPIVSKDYGQKEMIEATLKEIVTMQYLYVIADSLGILKERKFCLDRTSFLHSQLKYYYDNREFQSRVLITDKEIADYYEKNKTSYTSDRISKVSVLTFIDKNTATNNINIIEASITAGRFYDLNEKDALKGLISYQPNLKIERTDKSFSSEIIDNIFSIPENKVSVPFEFNGNCLLFFVTKREGTIIKEFNEVKGQIRKKLEIERLNQLRSRRILDLKKKYIVTINKTNKLI